MLTFFPLFSLSSSIILKDTSYTKWRLLFFSFDYIDIIIVIFITTALFISADIILIFLLWACLKCSNSTSAFWRCEVTGVPSFVYKSSRSLHQGRQPSFGRQWKPKTRQGQLNIHMREKAALNLSRADSKEEFESARANDTLTTPPSKSSANLLFHRRLLKRTVLKSLPMLTATSSRQRTKLSRTRPLRAAWLCLSF